MASGGNTGEMILWRAVDPSGPKAAVIGADGPAPTWKTCGALRGHADDVHDLAWSPDGSALVSGGVENICILWDVEAKRGMLRMENHQHYVQGVAWDPLGHYVCSQSNDRTCKVYGSKPPAAGKKGLQAPSSSAAALREFVVTANISKRVCAGVDTNNAAGMGSAPPAPAIKYPMFMDENISSFFRRLSWSPDGSFMAVPTGLHRPDASSSAAIPTTYIFARGDWSAPVAHLPSAAGRAPVVARFSPVLYALLPSTSPNNHNHCQHLTLGASSKQEHQQQQQQQQQQPSGDAAAVPLPEAAPLSEGRPSLVGSQQGNEEGSEGGSAGNGEAGGGDGGVVTPAVSPFMLPYRMVLAVATLNSVLVYDTQSLKPLALLGGLHMAPITDLAWSADGCSLAVSSQDGYCSLAVFEPGELGTPLQPHEMPSHVADTMQRTQAHKWAERCQQQAAAKAAAKQHQYSQHQQNQQQLQQQQDSQQQQQQQQASQRRAQANPRGRRASQAQSARSRSSSAMGDDFQDGNAVSVDAVLQALGPEVVPIRRVPRTNSRYPLRRRGGRRGNREHSVPTTATLPAFKHVQLPRQHLAADSSV
uniref:CAF1B/HIR1 beta-propeller domain-containing protein n=1 Tax=Dunaliella tertiolecta TaxID=3047 RepID=A0A7S3QY36_DUNTE